MLRQELYSHDYLINSIKELRDAGEYAEAFNTINKANIYMARVLIIYYKIYGVKKTTEKLHMLHQQMANP